MDALEKHIAKKLDGRKLAPSPRAWARIEAELEKNKGKEHGKHLNWAAIAAAVVVLVALSIFIFNDTGAVHTMEETIVVDKKPEENVPQMPTSKETGLETLVINEHEDAKGEVTTMATKKGTSPPLDAHRAQVVSAMHKKEVSKKLDSVTRGVDDQIINKANEVLAMVTTMEGNSIAVTEAEIDSLLTKAREDILKERMFNAQSKVDAMALLDEVELELFEESRDQLFDALKTSFFKLRTAVADRNQ